MALNEKHIVVLRDEGGNTYVVDHVALQETRVPEERKAEVEEALEGGELVGGGLLLEPMKSRFKVVGAYTIQHAGASQPPESAGET